MQIFEIKSCCSCGTVYRRRVFQVWILKDLDQRQVICKQLKVSSRAEKIIRATGILIITTKHTFPQERQLWVTKRRNNVVTFSKSTSCCLPNVKKSVDSLGGRINWSEQTVHYPNPAGIKIIRHEPGYPAHLTGSIL